MQQDEHQDDQQENDDETHEDELDPKVLSIMTAQEVMAFVEGKTGQRWMEDQRAGAWRAGARALLVLRL